MRYISAILGVLALALFAQTTSATTYYYWGTNHSLYDANTTNGWKISGIWTTDGVNPSASYPGVGDTAYFYSGTLSFDGSKEVADVVMETTADSVTAPTLDNEGTSFTVDDEFDTFTDDPSYEPGIYEQGLTTSSAASTIAVFTGTADLTSSTQVVVTGGTMRTGLSAVNQVSSLDLDGGYWNMRQGNIYISDETSYTTIEGYISSYAIFTNSGYSIGAANYGDYTLVALIE